MICLLVNFLYAFTDSLKEQLAASVFMPSGDSR